MVRPSFVVGMCVTGSSCLFFRLFAFHQLDDGEEIIIAKIYQEFGGDGVLHTPHAEAVGASVAVLCDFQRAFVDAFAAEGVCPCLGN